MSTLGWVNNELHRGRNQPVSMILGKVKAAVDLYIYILFFFGGRCCAAEFFFKICGLLVVLDGVFMCI